MLYFGANPIQLCSSKLTRSFHISKTVSLVNMFSPLNEMVELMIKIEQSLLLRSTHGQPEPCGQFMFYLTFFKLAISP
jgi:hypothetical protein